MDMVWKTDESWTDTWQGVKCFCSHRVQTGHGIKIFGTVGTELYHPGVKRTEREVQSDDEVKNIGSCTSSLPYLMVSCSVVFDILMG